MRAFCYLRTRIEFFPTSTKFRVWVITKLLPKKLARGIRRIGFFLRNKFFFSPCTRPLQGGGNRPAWGIWETVNLSSERLGIPYRCKGERVRACHVAFSCVPIFVFVNSVFARWYPNPRKYSMSAKVSECARAAR